MNVIDKFFWVLFVLQNILFAIYSVDRMDSFVQKKRILLILCVLIGLGNVPWLIMGYALVQGSVESIFAFVRPNVNNLYLVLFHLSFTLFWGGLIFWILFRDGDQFIAEHRLIQQGDFLELKDMSPDSVRVLAVMFMLVGVISEIIMWTRTS